MVRKVGGFRWILGTFGGIQGTAWKRFSIVVMKYRLKWRKKQCRKASWQFFLLLYSIVWASRSQKNVLGTMQFHSVPFGSLRASDGTLKFLGLQAPPVPVCENGLRLWTKSWTWTFFRLECPPPLHVWDWTRFLSKCWTQNFGVGVNQPPLIRKFHGRYTSEIKQISKILTSGVGTQKIFGPDSHPPVWEIISWGDVDLTSNFFFKTSDLMCRLQKIVRLDTPLGKIGTLARGSVGVWQLRRLHLRGDKCHARHTRLTKRVIPQWLSGTTWTIRCVRGRPVSNSCMRRWFLCRWWHGMQCKESRSATSNTEMRYFFSDGTGGLGCFVKSTGGGTFWGRIFSSFFRKKTCESRTLVPTREKCFSVFCELSWYLLNAFCPDWKESETLYFSESLQSKCSSCWTRETFHLHFTALCDNVTQLGASSDE